MQPLDKLQFKTKIGTLGNLGKPNNGIAGEGQYVIHLLTHIIISFQELRQDEMLYIFFIKGKKQEV